MRHQLNLPFGWFFFHFLVFCLFCSTNGLRIPFELDRDLPTVKCRKCVQFWASSDDNPYKCGPNSETCTGTACFMRQCKRCGLYQYITGCIRLTEWQLRDLQISRQKAELLNTRAGAAMLCEDNANHTTCICNRRDRCNDIHARVPFSTYSGTFFRGILNVDGAINDFDGGFTKNSTTAYVCWSLDNSSTFSCKFNLFFIFFIFILLKN